MVDTNCTTTDITATAAPTTATGSAGVALIGNTGMTLWVEQLAELLSRPTARGDWHVIGSAAILESPVERHAFDTAQRVAERLGVPLVEWTEYYEEVVGPVVLYVDRAYWGRQSPQQVMDGDYEPMLPDLVATLHRILEVFEPAKPIIMILSCYDFTHVPDSLRCIGGFDRRFDCRSRNNEDHGTEFLQWLGWDLCDDTLQTKAKEVGRLLHAESIGDRHQGLLVAALRRLVHDEDRLLRFADVVHFVLHGTSKFDVTDNDAKGLYRHAVHEAGHAVVIMANSGGANIPDYAAIGTSLAFGGVTTHSYSHRMNEEFDNSALLNQVRTTLGGRAAEEIVFGIMGMGARSSTDDLNNVTKLTLDLYLNAGLFTDFDDPETSTDHLIVAKAHHLVNTRDSRLSRLTAQ